MPTCATFSDGSITWQLNAGRDPVDVAARAATTPGVIRRYYDQPDLDAELRRRVTQFDDIDICEHGDPTDFDEVTERSGRQRLDGTNSHAQGTAVARIQVSLMERR